MDIFSLVDIGELTGLQFPIQLFGELTGLSIKLFARAFIFLRK
jgi:hypothetical protein